MDNFTLTLILIVGGFLLFRLFWPRAGAGHGRHDMGGGCCGSCSGDHEAAPVRASGSHSGHTHDERQGGRCH